MRNGLVRRWRTVALTLIDIPSPAKQIHLQTKDKRGGTALPRSEGWLCDFKFQLRVSTLRRCCRTRAAGGATRERGFINRQRRAVPSRSISVVPPRTSRRLHELPIPSRDMDSDRFGEMGVESTVLLNLDTWHMTEPVEQYLSK